MAMSAFCGLCSYNGNPKYFGGIVAFTRRDFIKINGFPNNFWGYAWYSVTL